VKNEIESNGNPGEEAPRILIKKAELAKRFGVSPRTVDNWVKRRLIPYIALSSRLHLFDPEAIQQAIERRYTVNVKG